VALSMIVTNVPMPAAAQESFGQQLRRLRRAAGLSQEALADRAGLSTDAVAALERGRRSAPRADTLGRLVSALELSPHQRDALVSAAQPAARNGLPAVQAPLPGLPHGQVPHNLPLPITSFVGRESDVAHMRGLLLDASSSGPRLLTLHGPGGIGKTRLALRVARSLAVDGQAPDGDASHYAEGIWLVDLSALDDPRLVISAVATALGAWESPHIAASPTLAETIGERHMLVVIDNCDHLIDACAHLADSLLRRCPNLRILATSREALGIQGESVWPVSPLPVAPSSSAVRLFVERAAAVRPDFVLDDANADTVTNICRQLDGVPLAIELAAARVGAFDVHTISARLADRFQFLTSGNRAAPARHRTLARLVQWSYDLLSPAEQRLFANLAVFAGGWDVAAAEAVAASGSTDGSIVVDLLARLVEKSLVVRDTDDTGFGRYHMLETLQEFAAQRLADSGNAATLGERHAHFYLARVEAIQQRVEGSDQAAQLDVLERDLDNIRAALIRCIQVDDASRAFRIAWALAVLAWLRGYLKEVDAIFAALLALPSARTAPGDLRAMALVSAGYVAFYRGQLERAHALVEEGLSILRGLTRRHETGQALVWLGLIVDGEGQKEQARTLFDEALAIFRELGDDFWVARAATNLGRCLRRLGDFSTAIPFFEEALSIRRRLDDRRGVANTLHHLADGLEGVGDHLAARATAQEALTLAQSVGDRFVTVRALIGLGRTSYALGDLQAADAFLTEAMSVSRRDGFGHELAEVAVLLAMIARDRDDLPRARQLAEDALQLAQRDARQPEAARALVVLGDVAARKDELQAARARYRDGLVIYARVSSALGSALALARLAAVTEPAVRAALFAGAAEAVSERAASQSNSIERRELLRALSSVTPLRATPGTDLAWLAGRQASMENLMPDVLGEEPSASVSG
jgi:predicted ATPase/transcriptional regulator with XRE-family HTH domain